MNFNSLIEDSLELTLSFTYDNKHFDFYTSDFNTVGDVLNFDISFDFLKVTIDRQEDSNIFYGGSENNEVRFRKGISAFLSNNRQFVFTYVAPKIEEAKNKLFNETISEQQKYFWNGFYTLTLQAVTNNTVYYFNDIEEEYVVLDASEHYIVTDTAEGFFNELNKEIETSTVTFLYFSEYIEEYVRDCQEENKIKIFAKGL